MTESGDRAAFLTRLRARLADGVPANLAHPAPAPSATAPPVAYRRPVPPSELAAAFAQTAAQAAATVHRVHGHQVPDDVVRAVVEQHGVRRAVVTGEPEAQAVGTILEGLGVEVERASRDTAERADLGVTAARAGVAATGSVVLDSRAGGRLASLLPPVHLCVVPAGTLVPAPADVLHHRPDPLPANLVLITGPSRTGDIELILTLGVHGPVALHIVLLEA